ncbi:MAG: ABC transporter permease [Promethearchaeota archaeon]
MSLRILFLDELKGFYKSKVMIILWIGIPLLSLLLHFIPNTEDFPITSLVAILIASIGGTLAAAMLSTSIASEKSRHVYDLFLIRPVRRSSILLAKFFAVYLCLIIATGISLMLGFIVDRITIGILPKDILVQTFESLFISLSGMAISCSIGMLFGILVSSVPVAAILSVYLGNQLTALSILPTVFLDFINPIFFALIIGISISTCILTISILTFNHKEF